MTWNCHNLPVSFGVLFGQEYWLPLSHFTRFYFLFFFNWFAGNAGNWHREPRTDIYKTGDTLFDTAHDVPRLDVSKGRSHNTIDIYRKSE